MLIGKNKQQKMKKINAEIVADSICNGHRITTMLLTYPRFIHSELMTHRMFSRNSASSRAIPFEKMVKMVEEDPFIPIAWQKDHKGMQGTEYITGSKEIKYRNSIWLDARDCMIRKAKTLNNKCSFPNNDFDSSYEDGGVTKQLCNRLLEPFMWHTVLITFTEISNFFELRLPLYETEIGSFRSKRDAHIAYGEGGEYANLPSTDLEWLQINKSQAEIHIQAIAEAMLDAYNESTPKQLMAGEYHIPFGDIMQIPNDLIYKYWGVGKASFSGEVYEVCRVMVATARCARLSYMTFDGEIDYEKDIKLHDQLLESKHASPMEHCAIAKGDGLFYANFNSWQSYRNLLGL